MKFPWVVFRCIPIILTFSSTATYAAEDMEEFFSMSPVELAATPVTIATGTAWPNFRSAGSTSVITEEQIRTMGQLGCMKFWRLFRAYTRAYNLCPMTSITA